MQWHAFAAVNKSQELDRLVARVEELLARLPQEPSPEISALRTKVDGAILSAWLDLGSETLDGVERLRHHRRSVAIAAVIFVGIAAGALLRRAMSGPRLYPS
jgi:hypothetical protein